MAEKIIGGDIVTPDRYPWIGSLFRKGNTPFTSHIGAAVLVKPQWMLTAAHCLRDQNIENIAVFLEGNVLPSSNVNGISIEEYHEHPLFNPVLLEHDIALIKLESVQTIPAIKFIDKVETAPLLEVGKDATVIGWGATGPFSPVSASLREVQIKMFDRYEAEEVLGRDIFPNMFCAGGETGDACQGDSGGAIFTKIEEIQVLLGLVCTGEGCGIFGNPGIYTQVAPYLTWINEKMALED